MRTAPRDAVIAASSARTRSAGPSACTGRWTPSARCIGPLLAFAILQASCRATTQSVFVVSFAAAVIGLAVLLLLVPDVRGRAGTRPDGGRTAPHADARTPPAGAAAHVRRPPLRAAAGRRRRCSACSPSATASSTSRCSTRDSLAINYFPLLYVGTNVAYLLLGVPFGRLADRVGRARVFLGGSRRAARRATLLRRRPGRRSRSLSVVCLLLLGGLLRRDRRGAGRPGRPARAGGARASGIATAQTVVRRWPGSSPRWASGCCGRVSAASRRSSIVASRWPRRCRWPLVLLRGHRARGTIARRGART